MFPNIFPYIFSQDPLGCSSSSTHAVCSAFPVSHDRADATMEHLELSQDTGMVVEREVMGAAAAADMCILLTGTSADTTLMARRIHGLGRGRPGRFRSVNCGWPQSVLEKQLFHGLRAGSSG